MADAGGKASPICMFERKFRVEGLRDKILLQIFEASLEDGDWICAYRLDIPGVDQPVCVSIAGADKLQSVTKAIRRIVFDLALIAERLGRKVTWLGEGVALI